MLPAFSVKLRVHSVQLCVRLIACLVWHGRNQAPWVKPPQVTTDQAGVSNYNRFAEPAGFDLLRTFAPDFRAT
jgi:hypothetical protein